ncbi:MAG: alpha-ketoglutarate-dependent dioxygenase AlkB [Steroidobacteraceae bacterium]
MAKTAAAQRSGVALTRVATDVTLLPGFVGTAALMDEIETIAAVAPFRHLRTRGGVMTVAMTNCGAWGWHSDPRGYRYVETDPLTGRRWPAMPPLLRALAADAAERGGFPGFAPDCCLVNCYAVGAQMGVHRDFDELDMRHPIVSVSIGLPATFLWYGASRSGTPCRVPVEDGDVLVWGGCARAGYHAVRRVAAPTSGAPAGARFNLTFRRAR